MFSVESFTTERVLTHLDLPAIHMTLVLPAVSGGKPRAARRINAFYAHMVDALEAFARKNLLPQAARSLDAAVERSRGFEPWRVKTSFTYEDTDGAPVITHRLYACCDGDEREREFTTVWDADSGLITRDYSG
ncbi:MAG: hypothetical protein LBN00_05705 [Oscillospiraceae bacterium]|jgi:hypothetical protein|nr:hypothetical protein [Oscillospiraceae bacterium]